MKRNIITAIIITSIIILTFFLSRNPAYVWDADALSYIDKLKDSHIKTDLKRQRAINDFIIGLKKGGIWEKVYSINR